MHQILVYADSLTWGIIPGTRNRLPFDERWPGVLENELNRSGRPVRVLEDCLNGRRTVWDDPFKPRRNGLVGLAQKIEMYSPLSLVIVMFGDERLSVLPSVQRRMVGRARDRHPGTRDSQGTDRAGNADTSCTGDLPSSDQGNSRHDCAEVSRRRTAEQRAGRCLPANRGQSRMFVFR